MQASKTEEFNAKTQRRETENFLKAFFSLAILRLCVKIKILASICNPPPIISHKGAKTQGKVKLAIFFVSPCLCARICSIFLGNCTHYYSNGGTGVL